MDEYPPPSQSAASRLITWSRLLGLIALMALVAAAVTASAAWSNVRLGESVGLVQTVYPNANLSESPLATRRVRRIDLSAFEDGTMPRRLVAARWSGTWQLSSPGPVDIYAGADDLVRVFIDDRLIVERNQQLGFHTIATPITLSAGPHTLAVEFVQLGGGMSLNVQWAPQGRPPRPFEPETLFPAVPDPALLSQARVAARLSDAARLAWLALTTLVAFVLALETVRHLQRWSATGVLQGAGSHARDIAVTAESHYARPAFLLSCLAVATWFGVVRADAINPETLWADDVWFACLTKLDSMWDAMSVNAPVAPAFAGLLWIGRRAVADPEVSLQLLPFVFGLMGPLLGGLVVLRITSSRLLALAAVALGFGGTHLAAYSVMVKPYTLDYVFAAVCLLLAVRQLGEGRDSRLWIAAAGLVSVLFSVPSVFLSVVLVHVTALAAMRSNGTAQWSGRSRWASVLAFDALMAVVYLAWLQGRSNAELKAFWSRGFVPLSSWDDFAGFLRTTAWTAMQEALPEPLIALAPLAGVGLIALLIQRKWRWFGAFLAAVYAGSLAASALQIYPIGTGDRVRTMIYTHVVTTTLVVIGFDGLTRWLPFRWVLRAAAAAVALLAAIGLAPPEYPRLDHVQMVRMLESRVDPADALVFNTSAAYLAGFYGRWPISTYPDSSPQGFAVRVERPLTLTLERSAEEGEADLDVLDTFLTRERPPRVFFLSTRRGTTAAEDVIRAAGFEEVRRNTSTISTQLLEFRRIGP